MMNEALRKQQKKTHGLHNIDTPQWCGCWQESFLLLYIFFSLYSSRCLSLAPQTRRDENQTYEKKTCWPHHRAWELFIHYFSLIRFLPQSICTSSINWFYFFFRCCRKVVCSRCHPTHNLTFNKWHGFFLASVVVAKIEENRNTHTQKKWQVEHSENLKSYTMLM
jgi:hypothetical protein